MKGAIFETFVMSELYKALPIEGKFLRSTFGGTERVTKWMGLSTPGKN